MALYKAGLTDSEIARELGWDEKNGPEKARKWRVRNGLSSNFVPGMKPRKEPEPKEETPVPWCVQLAEHGNKWFPKKTKRPYTPQKVSGKRAVSWPVYPHGYFATDGGMIK